MNIAKTLSILALTVIAGSAIAAPRGPINAKKITSTQTVNYTCQQGRVAVKYNFNGAGIPVTAAAKLNGATRVMQYDLNKSDNVDTIFGGRGYGISMEMLTSKNARKANIATITSPNDELLLKDCAPR